MRTARNRGQEREMKKILIFIPHNSIFISLGLYFSLFPGGMIFDYKHKCASEMVHMYANPGPTNSSLISEKDVEIIGH
jgi:hypothetical protein